MTLQLEQFNNFSRITSGFNIWDILRVKSRMQSFSNEKNYLK